MSWFRRNKREGLSIVVPPEGLAKLIRTLHFESDRFSELTNGIRVHVFAQSRGYFVVYLTPEQVDTLDKYVPSATIQSWFGDSDSGASE